MDHGDMDHGDMGGGMDMCSMSMLFNWDVQHVCIIFKWWHIRGPLSLIISLLAIVVLGAAYEALREATRRYESRVSKHIETAPTDDDVTENTPFLWSGHRQVEVSKRAHIIKAALYAFQNFYALMMMLVFMTYNGWVMIAVTIGYFVGYVLFGTTTKATKDTACH